MSLNSYYNGKFNNSDIINYKYSSFVPKINNSKPNFFPKIHSKYQQKLAPIVKTTFGVIIYIYIYINNFAFNFQKL